MHVGVWRSCFRGQTASRNRLPRRQARLSPCSHWSDQQTENGHTTIVLGTIGARIDHLVYSVNWSEMVRSFGYGARVFTLFSIDSPNLLTRLPVRIKLSLRREVLDIYVLPRRDFVRRPRQSVSRVRDPSLDVTRKNAPPIDSISLRLCILYIVNKN